MPDLNATIVLTFLKYLEEKRKVSIGTRNCRLAALRAFFSFVAHREPSAITQCAEIARIPTKKTHRPAMCYLEADEVAEILKQPDRSKPEGQRDHVLLAFLYNTGARIQEALNVRPLDIRFDSPAQVRLFGKGREERICPLWPETVALLRALLKRQPIADDEPVFINCYGHPLGAAGVRFKLGQYVLAATKAAPSLEKKNISPQARWKTDGSAKLIGSAHFQHRRFTPQPVRPPSGCGLGKRQGCRTRSCTRSSSCGGVEPDCEILSGKAGIPYTETFRGPDRWPSAGYYHGDGSSE